MALEVTEIKVKDKITVGTQEITSAVTSVGGTGTVAGLTLSGTVTTTGNLTLGGTLSTPVSTINDSTTVGQNLVKLTNPSAITFVRINANNTVDALSDSNFRTAIGAGTGNGTVTGVTGTSPIASSGGTAPAISLSANYGDTLNPYASKTANFFLASPNGTAGAPTFRAVVAADIPTLNQNTTGSAGSVANAVTFNNGGSGDASGTTYNGSAARTISFNTVGAAASSHTHTLGYFNSETAANLDTVFGTGQFSWATSTTGSKPENFGQGISIVSSGTTYNGSSNWITQLGFGTLGTTSYFRTKVNADAWSSWRKIWNEANDGASSGLDADLLDGQHGSYFLDTSGSSQTKSGNLTITGNTTAGRYYQSANGIPTGNLGNPTVTEMALFDEQFYNQTAFYDITRLKFYSSTDGTNFTEITTITDGQKRTLVGGDNGGGVTIPNLTPYYRIEITNNGNYVFLNALYLYMTTSSHATSVKIRARRRSDLTFVNFATSNSTVNLWPGHVYLPFSTIPFLTGGSSSGHYDIVHIDFQPTWSGDPTYGTQPIFIQKLQIWGGYPAGKRNVFSTDENANVAFPAALTGTRLFSNIATGTSPLSVTSTTVNTNLNADMVDGYHASSLWRSDGGTWNPSANIALNQSGNGQEWSFDIVRNGFTGGYWQVWDSAHGTMLAVNAETNRVGVGTASPIGKLDIQGSRTTAYSATAIVEDFFRIRNLHNSGGTNQEAGISLSVSSDNGTSNGVVQLSAVAPTSGASTADFVVRTRNAGTTSERMRILADGNVGIGTSSPAVKLHVVGGTRITGQLNVMGDAETKRVWVDFDDANDLGTIQVIQDGVAYKNLILQADGANVGIATRTPGEKLEVVGNAKATTFISTQATGTAPLTVASTTKVTNLNADLLDDMNTASTNTVSTVVARDSSGNFSAGTITAALTGTASGNIVKTGSRTDGNIPTFSGTDGGALGNGYTVETTLSGASTAIPRADAVKTYIDSLLNANDAMQFKGTIGTGGTVTALPTTHSAGWTYRVITAGTYAGVACEIGDLIIAVIDRAGTGNANSDWTVVQTNIDGAVIGPSSSTSGNISTFNGTSGKLIQDSGVSFETTLTTNSDVKSPTSKAVATYVTGLGYTTNTGTVTAVTGTAPIVSSGGTAPAISINEATTSAAGSMSSADKTKLDGIATGATANTGTVTSVATSGTVSGITLTGGTITTTGTVTLGGTLAVLPSNFASQTANTFLAAPNGTAGVPTFRAIVSADIPTLNQNTTGTAANVTDVVAIANGGTGQTTVALARNALGLGNTSGALPIANGGTGNVTAATALTALSGGSTAGSYLRGNGTVVALSTIQAADVPTLNQNTTGTAANVTGTVAIANGGTGVTTAQSAINALAGSVTSGQYLRGNGTNILMSAIQAGDVPTLNQNTTGTAANVTGTVAIANGGTGATTKAGGFNALSPMTTLGDVTYGGASGTGTRLAGNITTTKQFLSQTGTGSVSDAPAWSAVSKSDVGLGNVENTALSTWAGSANITTLGTVGTGTWSASTIAVNRGGTGQTSYTNGELLIGNTTGNTLTKATLTQGTGITITNGSGAITITNASPHQATNLTWTAGTTSGPTVNSSTGTGAAIPSASGSASGVVTTGSQTFAGVKTLGNSFTGASGTSTIITSEVIAGVFPSAPLVATGLSVTATGNSVDFHAATGIVAKAVGGLSNDAIVAYGLDGVYIAASDSSAGKSLRLKGVGGTSAQTTLQTNSATSSSITVTLPSTTGTLIGTGDTGTVTNTMLAGSIADSKLATISTAGKVSNSATTATNANTASAIVARDGSGNFTAGTITATLSGNATNVTGTVAVGNGGTGQTTLALARNAMGLGNTTGALPVANGGTNATSVSQGGIIYGASTSAYASTAAGALGEVLTSNTTSAPSWRLVRKHYLSTGTQTFGGGAGGGYFSSSSNTVVLPPNKVYKISFIGTQTKGMGGSSFNLVGMSCAITGGTGPLVRGKLYIKDTATTNADERTAPLNATTTAGNTGNFIETTSNQSTHTNMPCGMEAILYTGTSGNVTVTMAFKNNLGASGGYNIVVAAYSALIVDEIV